MRVILDTSTVLAYLLSRGPGHTTTIIWLAKDKRITLITSPATLAELKAVIALDKIKSFPGYHAHLISSFIAWYQYNSVTVDVTDSPSPPHLRDPQDYPFWQLAHASGAGCLISGDEDLLSLGSIGKMQIMKPAEFIRFWESNQSE